MNTSLTAWRDRYALYFALLVAWVAMLGSLYFSDVRHFVPCEWCWRQRILMYPLVLILSIGLWRRDEQLPYYSTLISGFGVGASTFHYLLQKTTWFSGSSCEVGVPCSLAYINWFGFITIPLLALIAFILIFMASLAVLIANNDLWDEEEEKSAVTWPFVLSIVVFALIPTALSFLPPAETKSESETSNIPSKPGATLYQENCAACHGETAQGIEGVGSPLVGPEFTFNPEDDEEWKALVRKGRAADDPDNQSGVGMPAFDEEKLPDADLQSILSYLRILSEE